MIIRWVAAFHPALQRCPHEASLTLRPIFSSIRNTAISLLIFPATESDLLCQLFSISLLYPGFVQ